MEPEELIPIFQDLFQRAKDSDEFEYACTLMRIRGIESEGWDTLEETSALFDDLAALVNTPLKDNTRLRLALLLYAHLTEVDAIYLILINMIEIIDGKRYSFDPFGHLYRPVKKARIEQIPPSAKSVIKHIITTAEAHGEDQLVQILKKFFNDAVRNAFFHSDYTIYGNEFRSREGHFLQANGTFAPSMPIQQLQQQINDGMVFYQSFMQVFVDSLHSYTSNKNITGRIHGNEDQIPLTLLADETGLRGFQSNNL